VQALLDRQAVVDTVVRYAWALDAKDWALARSCFADAVEADYGDLRGGRPERVPADAFVARRREALERLDTHHLSTNHLVTLDGDTAICTSATLIHRRDPHAAGIVPDVEGGGFQERGEVVPLDLVALVLAHALDPL